MANVELIVHCLYPDVSSGIYPWGLGLYNCVEGMSHLIELTELTFMYDNQGLAANSELLYPQDHFSNCGKQGYELEWERNNQVVVDYISDITSPARFPLYSSWWYKKLATNMVQFHRLHFLSGFLSPLNCKYRKVDGAEYDYTQTADGIYSNLNDNNLGLASFIDLRTQSDIKNHHNIESALLNASGIFRLGDESEISDIEMKFQHYIQNYNFMENSSHQAYSDSPRVNAWTGENFTNHAAFTVNSHAMKKGFGYLLDLYSQIRRRKAFFYLAQKFESDEMYFAEIEANLADLHSEYILNYGYYEEDEDEDDPDEEEESSFN